MNVFFVDAVFFIFTVFIFFKLTVYAWHEINVEHNLFGGVSTIIVTLIAVIFVNVMIWLN